MKDFITPNDTGIMADTDSLSIQNAVDEAMRLGLNKVVIPRINQRTDSPLWETDSAIILPSHIEIVLDNCYIRQKDGSMDNVFRNFDDDLVRTTLEEESTDIIIRGIGNAVIDGGEHNGLTQKNSNKDGLPHVEKNNILRFHNLRGLTLRDFTLLNQRWWAINLLYVEEAIISGLKLMCDNGTHNQDGIDMRLGCNNILIENIFGCSGDDLIALTGFYGKRESQRYEVLGKSKDIHDVIIRNVIGTSAECSIVAMRNQDGVRLYNITVDGIHDAVSSLQLANKNPSFVFNFDLNEYRSPKSPYTTVRIGQSGYATNTETKLGDVFGIHVTNIHTRTNTAILLNENIKNSYFGNIYAGDKVSAVITTRSCREHQRYGCEMENVVFENIFCSDTEDGSHKVFDLELNGYEHSIKNVVARSIFAANSRHTVNMQHGGELIINGMYGEHTREGITVREGSSVIVDSEKIG